MNLPISDDLILMVLGSLVLVVSIGCLADPTWAEPSSRIGEQQSGFFAGEFLRFVEGLAMFFTGRRHVLVPENAVVDHREDDDFAVCGKGKGFKQINRCLSAL